MTTELELVDSLYIRYYKLVACIAAVEFMQLCPLSRLILFRIPEVFELFRFCILVVSSSVAQYLAPALLLTWSSSKYEIT